MQLPEPNTAAAHLLRAIHESENGLGQCEFYPHPRDLPAVISAADELSRTPGWRVECTFRSSKGYIGGAPADYGHIGFRIERPIAWRALVAKLDARAAA